MNTGGSPSATAKVGGEQTSTTAAAAPGAGAAAGKPATVTNTVNERTYQEVEYLKKNLGPILVAALAEICIRRPADPIEYLGHWLLRWRYNEELKRRDVQNALDVVRQRQWAQVQEETAATKIEKYASGFIPDQAHGPAGYGGPLSGEELGENQKEVEESEFHPPEEVTGEGAEIQGEGGAPAVAHPLSQGHLSGGLPEDFSRKSRKSIDEGRKGSLTNAPPEGARRSSLGGEGRASLEPGHAPAEGERRASQVEKEKRASLVPGQEKRASLVPGQEKRASLVGTEHVVLAPSLAAAPSASAAASAVVAAPAGSAVAAAVAATAEYERKASLPGGQRKNSKLPEGHKESLSTAPPPEGERRLSDAAQPPPPPPQ